MIYVSEGRVFQAPFTGEDVGEYDYDTSNYAIATRPALALPLPKPAPRPTLTPTAAELAAAHMVELPDEVAVTTAEINGWTVRYWTGTRFLALPPGGEPPDVPKYANVDWQHPRPRASGKKGLKLQTQSFGVQLHDLLVGAVTSPPPTGDVRNSLVDIGMLGNDVYGDCGPAATEHIRMVQGIMSVVNGKPQWEPGFRPPHTAYTEGLYFAYGRTQGEPGLYPDYGVDNQSWLLWLFQHGYIEGFAEVDITPTVINGLTGQQRMHRAMLDFRGCLVGVRLTDDAEQLFNDHKPWTTANGESPDPEEGHDICLTAYDETYDVYGTWGAWQEATLDWTRVCANECYVILTKVLADRAGYDFNAAVEKLKAYPDVHLAPAV